MGSQGYPASREREARRHLLWQNYGRTQGRLGDKADMAERYDRTKGRPGDMADMAERKGGQETYVL
eukprot:scaffold8664_cov17-Tisochrysis_lutea.AAC.1